MLSLRGRDAIVMVGPGKVEKEVGEMAI